MWVIGIDGGGTKCEAGLFSESGELVAHALSGPANVYTNFDSALVEIEKASQLLIDRYNASQRNNSFSPINKQDCFLSLGCAGGGLALAKQQFSRWSHQYAGATLTSDVHVSCLAANQSKACALFVIGTGSCLAVYQDHQLTQFGGHGFLLGDIASGAWLGKQAVSWYLQALESPNNDLVLKQALQQMLGTSVEFIIEQYGQANASKFGALVPSLIPLIESSATVNQWFNDGVQYVCELVDYHVPKELPIFLTGGLASFYKPLIEQNLDKPIFIPDDNAVLGAYFAAQQYLQSK